MIGVLAIESRRRVSDNHPCTFHLKLCTTCKKEFWSEASKKRLFCSNTEHMFFHQKLTKNLIRYIREKGSPEDLDKLLNGEMYDDGVKYIA